MKIDMSIYSAMEKVLHIQRLLVEKLGRVPTLDELSQECGFDSAQVNKILSAADGFGCLSIFCITFHIIANYYILVFQVT